MGICCHCGGEYPIGPTGSCRMCMNKRRFREVNKDPLGSESARRARRLRKRAAAGPPDIITIVRRQLAGHPRPPRSSWRPALARRSDPRTAQRRGQESQPARDRVPRRPRHGQTRHRPHHRPLADHPTRSRCDRKSRPRFAIWTQVLRGQGNRPRIPLHHQTIRSYMWTLQQPLTAWSATYGSLREVTADDVNEQLQQFTGAKRDLAVTVMRSLFKTLKAERAIFTNPTTHLNGKCKSSQPASPIGLKQSERAQLLQRTERPADQLMVLLAGVHALRAGQIATLRLDDVDNASRNPPTQPCASPRHPHARVPHSVAGISPTAVAANRQPLPAGNSQPPAASSTSPPVTSRLPFASSATPRSSSGWIVSSTRYTAPAATPFDSSAVRLSDPTALRYCADAATLNGSNRTLPQQR